MPYATVIDVHKQNTARPTYTASTKPTSDQVVEFLDETAGVLDGILRALDYSLPIATTATGALKLLEHYNALGAAAMVEQAAPTSDRRKEAMALWENAQRMLRKGEIDLDADRDTHVALPRAPSSPSAFFWREQQF